MVYATLFTVLYDHTAYIELFEPIGLCFYSSFVSSLPRPSVTCIVTSCRLMLAYL